MRSNEEETDHLSTQQSKIQNRPALEYVQDWPETDKGLGNRIPDVSAAVWRSRGSNLTSEQRGSALFLGQNLVSGDALA